MSDGKRGGRFLPITDEQAKEGTLPATLPEEDVFSWKVASLCGRPGTIYEFECSSRQGGAVHLPCIHADTAGDWTTMIVFSSGRPNTMPS